MNDRRELKNAVDLLVAPLDKEERGILTDAFFYHGFTNHYCVCCLSQSPEILSQWRAYAKDGTGVALGFDKQFFKYRGLDLVECVYDDHADFVHQVREKHRHAIDEIIRNSRELVAANTFWSWLDENHAMVDGIMADLLRVKNSAFKEEREVRAIKSFKHNEISLRVSNEVIVPYKPVTFWEDEKWTMHVVLPEIWLGPKCSELNKSGLRSHWIGFVDIKRFDCGYS